tara:strand:+ start:3072 stop:3344 length:273 start_codon:yes stop_codon:yes gene_type:complete
MYVSQELGNEIKHFTLKILSNKIRNKYKLNPRKIDSLKIAESFFTNDAYFGNLFFKNINEKNRLIRQNDMLEQINSILSILQEELANKSN